MRTYVLQAEDLLERSRVGIACVTPTHHGQTIIIAESRERPCMIMHAYESERNPRHHPERHWALRRTDVLTHTCNSYVSHAKLLPEIIRGNVCGAVIDASPPSTSVKHSQARKKNEQARPPPVMGVCMDSNAIRTIFTKQTIIHEKSSKLPITHAWSCTQTPIFFFVCFLC